jgi:hypothetical protein
MKPKVMVLAEKEAKAWGDGALVSMSFMEAEQLIHDLKNGLFDLSNLSSQTGLEFFIILRK